MRKIFLFFLITFYTVSIFSGCASTEEFVERETKTVGPEGTYVAELPSASGMGRVIILHLFENGNAIRTSVYVGEPQGDYIEEGTWSAEGKEISVVLENVDNPDEKIELAFIYNKKGLASTLYDESPMGKEQVFFTRIMESF